MSRNLVKKQHVLPQKSIERFCNGNGMVQAHRIHEGKTFPVKPNNGMFCVRRVWDQRAEQGFGKRIEDRFQFLVESILASGRRSLFLEEHDVILKFYALWWIRSTIDQYDEGMSGNLVGVKGDNLTLEQRINVELKHQIFVEEGGVVPMHFKRGFAMQRAIDIFTAANSHLRWSITESKSIEFVVSDNPKEDFRIPITPRLCFICHFHASILTSDQVRALNLDAINRSKSYYFARDLEAVLYPSKDA